MEQEQSNKSKRRITSRLGWLGVLLIGIGSKLKALLPLLKFGKFGGTLITMAISIWGYALLFPFHFAVGLVIMIFIHEMGHVLAARIKGLPVSAPAFIPFLGALITMKKQPSDAATEAFVALGGPLLGTIGATATYGLGVWFDQEIFVMIAYLGLFINLFNLIPIHPLDGGRIVVAITRWLWIVGLVAGFVLIIYLKSILLILIYFLFVFDLWATYGKKKARKKEFIIETKVNKERFSEAGLWIPGENHQRSLPFRQYCFLDNQKEMAEVGYPGIGTILQFEMPGQIHDVQLIRTIPPSWQESDVRMVLKGTYTPMRIGGIQSDKKYYSVPVKLRWAFGVAYVGLAVFIGYMMIHIGGMGMIYSN
ncbi:MAG: site-2 protease family protein [Thermoactinomyces sp.]